MRFRQRNLFVSHLGLNTHLQAEPEENLLDGKLLIYVTLAYFTDSISSEKWVTSFIAVLFFVAVFTLTLAPICILCENIVFVFSSIKVYLQPSSIFFVFRLEEFQ